MTRSVRFRTLGLLSAVGRGREPSGERSRRSSRRCCWRRRPNGKAARSTATAATPAWRRRSRRAISDGPLDDELIARDIGAYLERHRDKELLRFITCGSVDDGKSTLIGRLLYDSKQIFDDQLASLEADSKKRRDAGQELDFALARRRALRRARAGHHDRRRLSLLRDRQAQVHRRRHAGARAIYPQHGHRRVDRRTARCCWSMRARAC